MKHLALATSFALALTFNVACEKDDDDEVVVEKAPPTPQLTEPVLENPLVKPTIADQAFSSPCLMEAPLDLTSSMRQISFTSAGAFTTQTDFFLGDSCGDSPYLTYETSGTYVDGGLAAGQTYNNIDFATADATLTVQAERQLLTFNANAYCGKSDWVIGEKVSLKELNCDFLAKTVDMTTTDIYAFEEETLYFGNNLAFNASAPTQRPTGLNRDVTFTVRPAIQE